MPEITNKDKENLEKSLSKALLKNSKGKLTKLQSDKIAITTIKEIDFDNSALMHKGVNWMAKEIIASINYNFLKPWS